MKPIPAMCNEGCGEQFQISDMPTVNVGEGVEKTYFTCAHCQREYVAFYTNPDIRKLQVKIGKVQQRLANPNYDHKVVAKQEAKIRAQIKNGMDELRARIEGGSVHE